MWNDRRLVRRAARGDSDAFAAIFRRYQQDLYRYCVAILGNEQDAQDALQNTMVKALRALPGEGRQIELKPWLYRVAHNESIELRRRTRPSVPLAEEVPAAGASPEERAADRRRLHDLLADIGELPQRHRGVLVMRELAGLDFEQIAAALDTSPGAARQALHQARRTLQQMSDGREMRCDAVTAVLSERDGRVARRRDLRAHLRDCPECRRFAAEIRGRRETFAGIAPLPALAAAAIAKGALSAAAGGGAVTGAAGGASGAGGAAGAVGGAAAKAASTGAILKSTAAIVAIAGLSGVAVEHGHLFHGGGPRAAGEHGAATVAHAASGGPGDGARHTSARAPQATAGAEPATPGTTGQGRRVEKVDPERPVTRAAATGDSAGRGGAAVSPRRPDGAGALGDDAAGSHLTHPARPEHPEHPTHPDHAAHPDHPDQDHATDPAHPDHLTHTDWSGHPVHASHLTGPSPAPSHFTDPSASTASSHPEHSSHPQVEAETASGRSDSTAEPRPELPEDPSHPTPPPAATAPAEGTGAGGEPMVTEPNSPAGDAAGETGP